MLIDSFLSSHVAPAMVGTSFDVADAGRADSVVELERLVAGLEVRVAEARETLATAERLVGRIQDGMEPMLEARRMVSIELLLRSEGLFDESRRLMVERAHDNENRAAVAATHLLPLLRRVTELTDEELSLYAEAQRDVRWALLAVEAAAEPAADGPVLAGPGEVGSFLQGLRAAP